MLKSLRKVNNGILWPSKQTSKVYHLYAAFKNLKIRLKEGNEWLQSKKESIADVFGGSNAGTNVRVICLEVEMHESRFA